MAVQSNLELAKDILQILTKDELEGLVSTFNILLKHHRKTSTMKTMAILKPGDKVKVHGLRQQHMNGLVGVVVKLKETRVECNFTGIHGVYNVNVPASCLEKIG